MRRLAIALGLLSFFSSSATAGLVTWEFGGEITSVDDPNGLVTDLVSVGSPFSGVFTFDSTTPDSFPDDPSRGRYDDALTSLDAQVGDLMFMAPPVFASTIRVINDDTVFGDDGFGLEARDLQSAMLGETLELFLGLGDSTGTVFSSDSLLLVPPDFSLFDGTGFGIVTDSETLTIQGELTFLVPEPTTLALLVLVALPLAVRRRKLACKRIAALVVFITVFSSVGPNVRAQWSRGPVLIGGDDTDHHFTGRGEVYARAGFSFLRANVFNGNTVAVCIGCNGLLFQNSRTGFTEGFLASDLAPPVGVWTTDILNESADIVGFFGNIPGQTRIEDVGIIYFPTGPELPDGSGINQSQLDLINDHAGELSDFVTGGGGLFTHTLDGLNGAYDWLVVLVPEIEAVGVIDRDDLNVTCAATVRGQNDSFLSLKG